jgi:hypothetical protein
MGDEPEGEAAGSSGFLLVEGIGCIARDGSRGKGAAIEPPSPVSNVETWASLLNGEVTDRPEGAAECRAWLSA